MCDRCAELEEEVAYLRSELGLLADEDALLTLKRAMRVSPVVARLVYALYRSNGRLLTCAHLEDAIPSKTGRDDYISQSFFGALVCLARRALGRDAIETAWGRGYRLSPAGMARVAAILAPAPIPQAEKDAA